MKELLFVLVFLGASLLPVSSQCQSLIEGEAGSSCMRDAVNTVSTGINGADEPSCITDDGKSCKSLHYTLNQINLLAEASATNTTWMVLVSSDLILTSTLAVSFGIDFSCLILCGEGAGVSKPTISTDTALSPAIHLESNEAALIISNLAFNFSVTATKSIANTSVILANFTNIAIIESTVTGSSDWLISAYSVVVSDSSFSDSCIQSAVLLIHANSVSLTSVSVVNTLFQPKISAIYGSRGAFAGSVVIILNGLGSSALIQDLIFWGVDASFKSNLSSFISSASLYVYAPEVDSRIRVLSSEFAFTQLFFNTIVTVLSRSSNIVFSNVTFHDQYLFINNHLILIILESSSFIHPVFIRDSSFYHYNGTTLGLICAGCQATILNNSFYKAYGQVFLTRSSTVTLSGINISLIQNEPFSDAALINLEYVNVNFVGHINILNNIGTPIRLTYSYMNFHEGSDVQIMNNTARFGGGLIFDEGSIFDTNSSPNALLHFENNSAVLGGAIYVRMYIAGNVSCSFIKQYTSTFQTINIVYKGNYALNKGNDILIDFGSVPPAGIEMCSSGKNYETIYSKIDIAPIQSGTSHLTVFPGQSIKFQAISISLCQATMYITCSADNKINSCPPELISLSGSSKVVILEGNHTITTDLKIKTDINVTRSDTSIDLKFQSFCDSSQSTVSVTLLNCSLGFTFNETERMCRGCDDCDSTFYQFSLDEGIACIRYNYWYGSHDGQTIIEPCFYPYCKFGDNCPLRNSNLFKLPLTSNEQCLFNRGGIMCRQCKDGYKFSYLGVQCVEDSGNCSGNVLGLLLLAIVLNVLIGFFWMYAIKCRGSLTLGFSFGAILFVAYGRLIQFGIVKEFEPIEVLMSFLSLIILDNSILGYIPACTPATTGVEQQLYNYIGPLVIICMIITIVIIANSCPKCLSKVDLIPNPIQTLSLLALVTFWSIASTSIMILLPIKIGDSYRFLIDPNIQISSYYTLAWLIAIPLLIIVIAIIVFMAISPFLSRKFNTVRIKPILDVFHSSFKDKWRWYSSVYFGTWIISIFLFNFTETQDLAFTILLAVSVFQFVFHPYAYKSLNITDTLIIIDLFTLVLLVGERIDPSSIAMHKSSYITFLVYVLVILPVLYYVFNGVMVNSWKLQCTRNIWHKIVKKMKSRSDSDKEAERIDNITVSGHYRLTQDQVTRTTVNLSTMNRKPEDFSAYRESLIDSTRV
uniref:G-protein coupled receptors family 3 profile domain-containing protein n=1 Tax=Amphimedon queenslandica TaxID=400682 RepID=A0A1X7TNJ2_AMPQE